MLQDMVILNAFEKKLVYGFKVYEKNGNYLQKVNLSMGAIITNGFGSSYYNEALPESPLYKRKK